MKLDPELERNISIARHDCLNSIRGILNYHENLQYSRRAPSPEDPGYKDFWLTRIIQKINEARGEKGKTLGEEGSGLTSTKTGELTTEQHEIIRQSAAKIYSSI